MAGLADSNCGGNKAELVKTGLAIEYAVTIKEGVNNSTLGAAE
jgi:hypothetical protein